MNRFRIICRESRLSFLQAEIVKRKIIALHPDLEVEVIGRSSRGDRELSVSLAALDGTDFFTEEIFEALRTGEAEIAVHSLKDMSAPHFFSHSAFAVVDRDDVRDIALFNPDIEAKIRNGETIIIGTCSPRREEMAVKFLKNALPQLGPEIKIVTASIRGNVEGRLRQLRAGKYDATILATAGLNRLLRSPEDEAGVRDLLSGLKTMLLPLVECVPAPCQGAIVAEAHPSNARAVALLAQINEAGLWADACAEKQEAFQYGTGCLQKFGVTTVQTNNGKFRYAAGEDAEGRAFSNWTPLPAPLNAGSLLFSSTDHMRDFFDYHWMEDAPVIHEPIVFIANYKAIRDGRFLRGKRLLASGTKTWYELAKKGYWVEASADALGIENLMPALAMPVLGISRKDICLLTHAAAAERWRAKGYKAVANYQLLPTNQHSITGLITKAEHIFWTSFAQYECYGSLAAPHAQHYCPGGETAALLKKAGLDPVIFPNIKSFEQWRQSPIRSHNAA